ncbi:MAG: hypothetical protein HDT27_01475 [Subdoligranulum sp.]|nr:hypothetical protein [Subdoligranulum sp.]
MKWNDDKFMLKAMPLFFANPTEVPFICPCCKSKAGHIYMDIQNLQTRRGGLWLWCDACMQFDHSSVFVPSWWCNLDVIDRQELCAIPTYLSNMSNAIDIHVNKLIRKQRDR